MSGESCRTTHAGRLDREALPAVGIISIEEVHLHCVKVVLPFACCSMKGGEGTSELQCHEIPFVRHAVTELPRHMRGL